ncbi:MAG: O-antigen ligase family protein [Candidatus Goldbacteria bacterium]|nr:O-antigen ligase family protein [Candidatus Goldiibacteriota bacterium]
MKKDFLLKFQNILFLFILFFLPLFFCPFTLDPFWVAEQFFFKFLLSLFIIAFLMRKLINNTYFVIYKTPYNLLFFGFIILNIIGVIVVHNYFLWANTLILNIFYFFLFLISLDYSLQNKNNYKKILVLILISNLIVSFYGLMQSCGFDPLRWQTDFSRRAASTLGNPNFLAGHLLLAIPFGISLFFSKRVPKSVSIIIIIVLCSALILSQTRGAYIGFIASLTIFFILVSKYEKESFVKLKTYSIVVFLMVFIILLLYIIINLEMRTKIKNALTLKDSSAKIRLSLWKNTMYLIKDNPLFGSGPGNFEIKYAYYQYKSLKYKDFFDNDFYKSAHAHNDLLQIMGEYGLLASGFIVALFYLIFLNGISILKTQNNAKFFIIGILSSVIGILIHGLFNFPLLIIPTASTFYILLGSLVAFSGNYEKKEIKMNLILKITFVLFVFIFIFLASILTRIFLSNFYLRKSGEASHFKMNRIAIEHSSNAVAIAPWVYENYYINAKDHLNAGDIEKAYKLFEKVYELNPGHWETNVFLFEFYASNNMHNEMLKIAENMYKLSPYSVKAITSLGYAYYINGKFDKAILTYEKGYYNLPEKYDILYHLSAAYGAIGDTEKAIFFARKAIDVSEDNAGAYYNLAVAYIKSGNIQMAKETLNEMLKKHPDNKNAKDLLKVLKNEIKK